MSLKKVTASSRGITLRSTAMSACSCDRCWETSARRLGIVGKDLAMLRQTGIQIVVVPARVSAIQRPW